MSLPKILSRSEADLKKGQDELSAAVEAWKKLGSKRAETTDDAGVAAEYEFASQFVAFWERRVRDAEMRHAQLEDRLLNATGGKGSSNGSAAGATTTTTTTTNPSKAAGMNGSASEPSAKKQRVEHSINPKDLGDDEQHKFQLFRRRLNPYFKMSASAGNDPNSWKETLPRVIKRYRKIFDAFTLDSFAARIHEGETCEDISKALMLWYVDTFPNERKPPRYEVAVLGKKKPKKLAKNGEDEAKPAVSSSPVKKPEGKDKDKEKKEKEKKKEEKKPPTAAAASTTTSSTAKPADKPKKKEEHAAAVTPSVASSKAKEDASKQPAKSASQPAKKKPSASESESEDESSDSEEEKEKKIPKLSVKPAAPTTNNVKTPSQSAKTPSAAATVKKPASPSSASSSTESEASSSDDESDESDSDNASGDM